MVTHQWKLLVILSMALFILAGASPGRAEERGDRQDELEKIKAGLEQMRASYEMRIEALEERVGEQDLLRAKIDEKEREIQSLKDKVTALEDERGEGGLARRVERLEQAEAPRHTAAPVGAYGGLMNPDISVIANFKAFLSDDGDNPLDERFLVEELELGFQGFLWPGIRGDAFVALEQHVDEDGHVETEIDLEEAYVSFLDLPGGLQVQAGRKLQDFGRVNPIHPHHWSFPDTPLPLRRLFGDHPWFDDGVQVSALIPNPWEAYVKLQGGVWSGRQLGHVHGDEHEHEEEMLEEAWLDQLTSWNGNVFTARASLDFPLSDDTNLMSGYSFAGDDGGDTFLHGLDLTLIHRWPQSYRRLRWQNELFYRDWRVSEAHHEHDHHHLDVGERDADDWGGYSLLALTLTKYWETGLRFDWWDADHLGDEWGVTTFLSYFFSHSMYLRPAYRYSRFPDGSDEHLGLVQFVWGLGPHAHRLED
jgi:hypothetical protein